MAAWAGLGQAATVAQLVGADVGGLISMIMQAAVTARQNKKACEQLARRILMIAELLSHLQDTEVMRRNLAGLEDTLREAHELVASCQGRSTACQFIMAGRQANKFRDMQSRIDSYLFVFPVISHVDITRRLDRIYNILLPRDSTTVPEIAEARTQELDSTIDLSVDSVVASLSVDNLVPAFAEAEGVFDSIREDGDEFTFAELAEATKNFAPDMMIGEGSFGKVYIGRLPDGREVAIKRDSTNTPQGEKEFMAEVTILSSIRHEHIIGLLGWCVTEREEHLLVYEYMKNGSLDHHLFGQSSTSSSSPMTASWKMRIEILLGVSRAIEYLQSSDKTVIHRDIKSSNILLDASWAPRLTDFGLSLALEPGSNGCEVPVIGTVGYVAPDYVATGHLKPTSDVYSLGVVMLEVLTGRKAMFECEEEKTRRAHEDLVYFALPFIQSGKLLQVLDRRPAAKPTRKQLKAVKLVARTAARCVQLQEKDRPAMSNVVASLEVALELVRRSG